MGQGAYFLPQAEHADFLLFVRDNGHAERFRVLAGMDLEAVSLEALEQVEFLAVAVFAHHPIGDDRIGRIQFAVLEAGVIVDHIAVDAALNDEQRDIGLAGGGCEADS